VTAYPDQLTIESQRKLWRNPMVDQPYDESMDPYALFDDGEPNVVSSLCEDGLHRPALDIDYPISDPETFLKIASGISGLGMKGVTISPSVNGNCHLYATEPALPWDEYADLVQRLVDAGLVEARYLMHALQRGQTCLRLPGVPKP
jgi:hypothetical protein